MLNPKLNAGKLKNDVFTILQVSEMAAKLKKNGDICKRIYIWDDKLI